MYFWYPSTHYWVRVALYPPTKQFFPVIKYYTQSNWWCVLYGPLIRYVKLRVAHAPGMPGTFSPPPRVSDPGMHHGTCVTQVPWCIPGVSGSIWSRWRGKRSRHSRHMHNPQFYVCGKRPMVTTGVDLKYQTKDSKWNSLYLCQPSRWAIWCLLQAFVE